MNDLVIHVPHASKVIPDDVLAEFTVPVAQLREEAAQSADLLTDLIAHTAWPQAAIVEAAVSRLVVDVERYESDADEEMATVGRRVLYTHDRHGRRIRATLHNERRQELLVRYYRPHWARLRALAVGKILIDLHSYPKEPWPIEHDTSSPRPEIDLGWSPQLTPAGWLEALTGHFRSAGYQVGHNTPYAGVIDAGAQAAVMIEIRRDIIAAPGSSAWLRLTAALASMPLPDPKTAFRQPTSAAASETTAL